MNVDDRPSKRATPGVFFAGPLIVIAVTVVLVALLTRADGVVIAGVVISGVALAGAFAARMLQRREAQREKGIVCG